MKTISVLIPCYNEIGNVEPISKAIIREFIQALPKYNYEIVFIDNFSTDGKRAAGKARNSLRTTLSPKRSA